KKAGFVSTDEISMQTYYDDAETFRMFRVASAVIGVSVDQLWEWYGDFLVTYSCETGWEKMLTCMASNLQDFLDNLNSMHYFIDQIAFKSEMKGPTFKCDPQISVVERTQERRKSGMVDHVIFSINPDDQHKSGQRLAHKFRRERNNIDIIIEGDESVAPSLPITLRDFNRIFPYHICFNKQMVVEHVGVFLLNEYNLADKKALKLTDIVQLVQPTDVQLTFKNIMTYLNTLFIFQLKVQSKRNEEELAKKAGILNQPLSLKGQMQMLSGGNSIIFLASPHATSVRDILNVNLFISDMPMHDATRDLIMLNQSRMCQMELNKRLEETSKKMKGCAEELEKKKAQTDHLLFQFVPVQIAEALRQHKPLEPQTFNESTVLVSELPDFLSICFHTSPSELIGLLTDIFHRFDRLIHLNKVSTNFSIIKDHSAVKVYKVVSLMDSYLIVGGVPSPRVDHTESVLNLALGMMLEARAVVIPSLNLPVRLRIGISCGPVVAGIVSERKPRYCVLGDTVITAKQIVSYSECGKVLVGNAVRTAVTKSLKSIFVFSSKGYVDTGTHKTLTHYLEKNEQKSAWDIVDREKGAEQSIDGYKELHSKEGGEQWETITSEAQKQQEVIDAMRGGVTQKNRALARLLSIKEWRFRSNRSNDSGISIESRDNPQSSVCSIS
ncbi:hypothetical protein PFISCL1PPCAC_16313, partial [Pristionchus fissidentatus]